MQFKKYYFIEKLKLKVKMACSRIKVKENAYLLLLLPFGHFFVHFLIEENGILSFFLTFN